MAAALGVQPDRLLTPYQIHSPDVVVADEPWTHEDRPRADAIVTRTPRLAIGVSTADCGPLLLADSEAGVIGAAHAGWRGALTGVIEAAVAAMERLGAERAAHRGGARSHHPAAELRGRAGIRRALPGGRCGQCALLRDRRSAPATPCSISPATSPTACNAPALYNSRTLALCTYAEPERFFSYRRTTKQGEPDYGRHINAIALAD